MTNGEVPRSKDDVRRFFERWLTRSNSGDWSGVAEMMHADIVLTDPMLPVPARGRAEALQRARGQYEPFHDGKVIAATLFFDTTDVARQLLAAPAAGSRAEQLVAVAQRLRTRVDRVTRR